jgi:hypothetical protein
MCRIFHTWGTGIAFDPGCAASLFQKIFGYTPDLSRPTPEQAMVMACLVATLTVFTTVLVSVSLPCGRLRSEAKRNLKFAVHLEREGNCFTLSR